MSWETEEPETAFNRDTYREYNAINYSLLAGLSKDPSSLIEEKKESSKAMTMGSLVDLLITEPKKFNEQFIVCEINKPADTIAGIIEQCFKDKIIYNLEEVEKVCFKMEYGKSWNKGTAFRKIEEAGGRAYYEFLNKANGKNVLSYEEWQKALKVKEVFLNHPFTKEYFTVGKNEEILMQHPVLFTIDGVDYKILLDLVKINHKEKWVQPADIKVLEQVTKTFPISILKWRYDIQGSLYTEGVANKWKGYKIKPFKFIVGSWTNPKKPLVFCTNRIKISEMSMISFGAKGGFVRGKKYKGWKQLSEELIWHGKTQQFDYAKEIYENNGETDVNII